MKDKLVRSHDMELIKLYLEEFRLDILSMKSQLSRMSRNSKHVRTTLKELKSAKCIGKEIGENDFIQFYRNDKNNNIIYLFLWQNWVLAYTLLASFLKVYYFISININRAYTVYGKQIQNKVIWSIKRRNTPWLLLPPATSFIQFTCKNIYSIWINIPLWDFTCFDDLLQETNRPSFIVFDFRRVSWAKQWNVLQAACMNGESCQCTMYIIHICNGQIGAHLFAIDT